MKKTSVGQLVLTRSRWRRQHSRFSSPGQEADSPTQKKGRDEKHWVPMGRRHSPDSEEQGVDHSPDPPVKHHHAMGTVPSRPFPPFADHGSDGERQVPFRIRRAPSSRTCRCAMGQPLRPSGSGSRAHGIQHPLRWVCAAPRDGDLFGLPRASRSFLGWRSLSQREGNPCVSAQCWSRPQRRARP
jgi:hypothetical protein